LQRVGKAALQALNNEPVTTTFRAQQAREHVRDLQDIKASAGEIKKAEADVQTALADPGLKERLKQPFFQPWFQYTMFLFLLIGFAIKVPVFPFHTWLPDAHVEAPTPISMILAGVRCSRWAATASSALPIRFVRGPPSSWPRWVALFGIINIVYGAFAAMAQTDFKKLVAYSSVSHMGYVLLGIAVWSAPERAQYWELGHERGDVPDDRARHHVGRHVLPRRRHLRPGASSPPGQLPRPVRADAALRRHQRRHLLCRDGAAGNVRLRRRVHGGAVHLEL
jgi:NADH-quinone oxidoreductase subunit M